MKKNTKKWDALSKDIKREKKSHRFCERKEVGLGMGLRWNHWDRFPISVGKHTKTCLSKWWDENFPMFFSEKKKTYMHFRRSHFQDLSPSNSYHARPLPPPWEENRIFSEKIHQINKKWEANLELESAVEEDHCEAAGRHNLPSQNRAESILASHLHQRGRIHSFHPAACSFCDNWKILNRASTSDYGNNINSDAT